MKIKELKAKIADLPDHMDVMMEEIDTEYGFALLNEAVVEIVTFKGEKQDPKEKCLILKGI
jgi:hypothetical protein